MIDSAYIRLCDQRESKPSCQAFFDLAKEGAHIP